MQRRLRITLAVAAAAGVAVLGAGTAEAQGMFTSPTDNNCPKFVKADQPKEADFPNDTFPGNDNAQSKDLRDSHGDTYYTHNEFCDGGRPWRGSDWHDDSYKTFHYSRLPGSKSPAYNNDKNTYNDGDGYNKSFRKDPHKYTKLEPDHIGASKHPKYLSE